MGPPKADDNMTTTISTEATTLHYIHIYIYTGWWFRTLDYFSIYWEYSYTSIWFYIPDYIPDLPDLADLSLTGEAFGIFFTWKNSGTSRHVRRWSSMPTEIDQIFRYWEILRIHGMIVVSLGVLPFISIYIHEKHIYQIQQKHLRR